MARLGFLSLHCTVVVSVVLVAGWNTLQYYIVQCACVLLWSGVDICYPVASLLHTLPILPHSSTSPRSAPVQLLIFSYLGKRKSKLLISQHHVSLSHHWWDSSQTFSLAAYIMSMTLELLVSGTNWIEVNYDCNILKLERLCYLSIKRVWKHYTNLLMAKIIIPKRICQLNAE